MREIVSVKSLMRLALIRSNRCRAKMKQRERMRMDYREMESISTGIHTRISDTVRISSGWRTYANGHFASQKWETFLWDGDKIIGDYKTYTNANDVVNLHIIIAEKYRTDRITQAEREV